jgi:hypothetical protein
MNRRRPTHLRVVGPLPGVHDVCSCGARVRKLNGAVYEVTSGAYHACRGAWQVDMPEPKPRRLGWLVERIARWLSW